MTEAYCMKCKQKQNMIDEEEVIMKNGRKATKGICPVCGTKMFRIGSTSTDDKKSTEEDKELGKLKE